MVGKANWTSHNRIVYVRRLEAARLRKTPVGLTPFVGFFLRHIARPRNATHCFKGGGQRHIQPERYAQFYLTIPENIDKIIERRK